jgi:PilZ domain
MRTNRRNTPRFKLQTSLYFSRIKSLADGEHEARTINISKTGVCFFTGHAVEVGEVIKVLLEIPRRVTGVTASTRRFTGKITRINRDDSVAQVSRVSVQLLYSEALYSGEILQHNCN